MNSNLRNSVYGAFGFIFPVAVFLVTTPYILHKLTPEVYGIYVLAISLIGLMSFLDLGFGQGIIKFVSHYEARGDYERINKIVLTSLVIYTVMGLIGAFVIYLLSDFLVSSVFKLSLNNLAMGSLAFKIVAFGFL
jgi:Polysaccharide biosynthesis protein.